MKYYFLTGERSGDMHAANLAAELKKTDPDFSARGFGGDKLKEAGVELDCGLERLSFMGFWEVVKHLPVILQNFKIAKRSILNFQPDVVILVDNPGFNMPLAKWCKAHGIKVAYYILPQVWAWNHKRVYRLRENCDLLIGILPFEKEFYTKYEVEMHYAGHPLLDIIHENKNTEGRKSIALLPGSRKQEIYRLMPVMLETAESLPHEKFVIAGLSKLKELYPAALPPNVSLVFDSTYEVVTEAKAAVVCSGTATLETALLNTPQVVVYKTGAINAQIVKRVAKVPFAALPNLIAGEKTVEELLQWDCTPAKIASELKRLVEQDMSGMYKKVQDKIGEAGASARAAELIFNLVA